MGSVEAGAGTIALSADAWDELRQRHGATRPLPLRLAKRAATHDAGGVPRLVRTFSTTSRAGALRAPPGRPRHGLRALASSRPRPRGGPRTTSRPRPSWRERLTDRASPLTITSTPARAPAPSRRRPTRRAPPSAAHARRGLGCATSPCGVPRRRTAESPGNDAPFGAENGGTWERAEGRQSNLGRPRPDERGRNPGGLPAPYRRVPQRSSGLHGAASVPLDRRADDASMHALAAQPDPGQAGCPPNPRGPHATRRPSISSPRATRQA